LKAFFNSTWISVKLYWNAQAGIVMRLKRSVTSPVFSKYGGTIFSSKWRC